jgi:membrane associated rhomboid family serine protease
MMRRIPLLQTRLPWSYFHATLGLIAINLVVFLLTELDSSHGYGQVGWSDWLAMSPSDVIEGGAWWQLFTYMYVHSGVSHIFFNMLGLFMFGTAVEQEMGSWEFLLYYHLTGALAGLASLGIYWVTGQDNVQLIGASGAVFAVMLAFAAFRPHARILLFFVLPLRARTVVLLYAAIELFSEVLGYSAGVAHLTHLAGFLFAFLYLLIRLRVNAWRQFWL